MESDRIGKLGDEKKKLVVAVKRGIWHFFSIFTEIVSQNIINKSILFSNVNFK